MLGIISQIYVDIDLTSKYLETKLHFVTITVVYQYNSYVDVAFKVFLFKIGTMLFMFIH